MTLTELRYIVAVARERHFGRAAEACFVSQPTLSVAVRKLEEELELAIFERGKGEVSITPAGDLIIAQAQRVLEEASKIHQLSEHGRDQLEGPLRIGAIYTVGPYLFPDIVPELAQKALGYLLSYDEVSCVIPGTRTLDQLNSNLAATACRLSPAERGKLEALWDEITGNGSRLLPW